MSEKILDIGSLKKLIKDLPDDLPIECEVHKLTNTYIINDAYRCGNAVGEPILCLEIKTDWDLTERDEKAQTCNEYKSDEGTYECPHCNRTGLKPLNYGSDSNPEIVWECMRCGAELWYCETVEEM